MPAQKRFIALGLPGRRSVWKDVQDARPDIPDIPDILDMPDDGSLFPAVLLIAAECGLAGCLPEAGGEVQ